MWKYITRNVRETFERRICSTLTDTKGQDKATTCQVKRKFLPTLTHFSDQNSSNRNFKSAPFEENQQERTGQSSWNDEYHRHTWLGALGWSTAIVFSWNLLQPLSRLQFLHDQDRKHACKQYNRGYWKDNCGWHWKKDNKFHKKCPLQSGILRYKSSPQEHRDNEEHFWKSIPRTYERKKYSTSGPKAEKESSHDSIYSGISHDSIYSGIWKILTHTVCAQPTKILPKPVQFDNKTLKDKDESTKYGPLTAEQALDDATQNFITVQNSVMGDIDNKLGVDLMQSGKHHEAISYFSRAASFNNSSAAYNLGICYEMGLGTNQDFKMAAQYYKRASEQGHATAMYNLGVFYVHGWGGLPSDCSEAKNLFEKAGALGQTEAKRALEMVKIQDSSLSEDETENSLGIVQQALGFVQDLGLGVKLEENSDIQGLQVSKPNEYKDISDLVHDSILKYTSMLQK